MTREDIIRMAREAGFVLSDNATDEAVDRFERLLAAEREACAQVAMLKSINGIETAAAIRARGEATLREQV